MAALLIAGGPCSPAEARAKLTQVREQCCRWVEIAGSLHLTLHAAGVIAEGVNSVSGAQDEQLTIDVFKKNTPSVVYIENLALRYDTLQAPFPCPENSHHNASILPAQDCPWAQ